ncbi:MAG: hypothetical protein G01um101416_440 [Microgenomates group bacterium Gr01-1014_16]|nr:MAG: hypothetical protein G01um101416_440 [Microgenomates group bacterium Gr01-1014_16]
MPKLFGTSGIRGPADELFTNDFCRKLGAVFGTWLKSKNKTGFVAIANDPRESSPRIKDQIIRGLDLPVLDEGVVPTPALTYFVKNSPQIAGGIMVTGSHIAAHLNGVKLLVDGEEISKIHELEIEELFSNLDARRYSLDAINIKYDDSAKEMYLSLLRSLADAPYPAWKIVVDTANGAQTDIIRQLFIDLNLDYICTGFCDIQSPNFAGRDTEKPSDYSDLAREILLSKADLGIGFDVDGDRVIFIDQTGKFVPGDYTCTLLAKHSSSAVIVTPISTSSAIDHIGKRVFRTPVGSTNVAAKMKEVGSTFGFEANGGAVNSEIHFGRDGGTTAIKILNLLKKLNKPLSQALTNLPQYTIFRDKIDCPFSLYSKIYSQAEEIYSDKKIDNTDGVKVWLNDEEWLLFRGSGNAPEFRVFAESPDSNRSTKLGKEGLELVKSLIHPSNPLISSNPSDSLGIYKSILDFPNQCKQVIHDLATTHIPQQCYLAHNIVISGMGGSALGGRIVASLERQTLKILVTVSTEYHLPNFANEKSLVIISSYSGNTEESLSALAEARSRGCQIFILTSGGQLAQQARQFDLPCYIFSPDHNPSGQPRMGLGYNILSIIFLLARCQLIHPPAKIGDLPKFLSSRQSKFAQFDEFAKLLASRIPVIISSEHLKGAAHAVQNMLHENAKTFCAVFDLPEADHHLIEGLSYPPQLNHQLAFVFIQSAKYHPETAKRYPLTAEIVKKHHIPALFWQPVGDTPFFETMDIIQSGAYLSFKLAQLAGIDPGPIPWVDWLKEKLK